MEDQISILEGYSDLEKGAYLGAIASLATADRSASAEELQYIDALVESAGLAAEQAELIRSAASKPMADDDLKRCLEVLKTSELRFSLISDIIAFASADSAYSEEEKKHVEEIANYLGVNHEQLSLLDQFTKKAVKEAPDMAKAMETTEASPFGFLENLGFGDKMKNAGINTNSILKGALGIIGPMLLMNMFRGGRRNTMGAGGGLLGGMGNLGGGLGSLLGGGLLGGLLGGGRGFSPAGGMLGRILRGGR
jgi:uncharacterized tellurite resistance protein B-like protein